MYSITKYHEIEIEKEMPTLKMLEKNVKILSRVTAEVLSQLQVEYLKKSKHTELASPLLSAQRYF